MNTVSTSSIDASGVNTSSISTPSINVSDTNFHGVTQTSINVSETSVNEAYSVVTYGVHLQSDHGASFWVA